MVKKTAILFGPTGLTGMHVLKKLIENDSYKRIKIFTRSDLSCTSNKAEIFKTPLEDIDKYEDDIKGDDLFCCLGTTIKKAGSRKNFRKVDYEFPVKIAQIAEKNRVPGFHIISAIGAGAESSSFYLRTKGELENDLLGMDFERLIILRPSLLLGKRDEFRLGEEAAKAFMWLAGFLLWGRSRKYRGIEAETVAQAMVKLANSETGKIIFESDEIELHGKNH